MPTRLSKISAIALCAAGAACFSSECFAATITPKPTSPQADSPADPAAAARTLDAELHRAQSLRAQGNYAEATRALSQLMLAAPDDARVVGEYGKVLAQQGRSQDAIAFLKRATELQPNDATLYSALGVAYDQADDPKNAKATFERALLLKPGDPVVLNNYAVSRMLAGDLDGAERLLAQAKASGGALPKISSNLALLAQLKLKRPVVVAKPGATDATGARPSATRLDTTVPGNASLGTPKVVSNAARVTPASSGPHVAGENPQAASVVMQKVPVDPQAGPVARATRPPRKLASPSSTESENQLGRTAAKKSAIPVLRTADQDD